VQCMLTPYLTLASVVSLFSFFFSSYTFVYLFAGVPWHLCIKDSSVSSTLSLIQLPEHLVESTGCMGRKA
jgi:hypothetical protein